MDEKNVKIFKDDWGRVTKKIFDGGWVAYEYDNRGNLIEEHNSDNDWFKRVYNDDNLCISEEDNFGNWRKVEYDSYGRTIAYSDKYTNQKTEYNELGQVVVFHQNKDKFIYEYDSLGRHNKIIYTDGKWVSIEFGDVVYELDKSPINNPDDGISGVIYIHSSDGTWWTYERENGRLINNKDSRPNNLFYIEYARASYSHWTDDMFDKYHHLVNWEIVSYLPRLSYYVIDKFSNKLNMKVVNFFRGVWRV